MLKVQLIFLFLFSYCSVFSQWQPDVRLTFNTATSYTSATGAWCVAADGQYVHVAWYDNRDGNYEIYYKRSTNGGANWSADVRLTNSTGISWMPSIAAKGRYVHIAWTEVRNNIANIYYIRSDNSGSSWWSPVGLTDPAIASSNPSISVSGSYVHLVWQDNAYSSPPEIEYKRSFDNGATWGATVRVTNGPSNCIYGTIASSGQNLHVAWHDDRATNEIYYIRSTNNGVTWGPEVRLADGSGDPSISVSGQIVHVVWEDQGNLALYRAVYYKRSTDGGVTWGSEQRLNDILYYSEHPTIISSGSKVHVVWEDRRNSYYAEIYYDRSTNGGVNWSTDTRLSFDSLHSGLPSIALSGTMVHVVWFDTRDGNMEIYYKQNPTANPFLIIKPSKLDVKSLATGTIDISWESNADNADGFFIERSINPDSNWAEIQTVDKNTKKYTDTGLDPNTIYYYRVYAFNELDVSDYSDIGYDTVVSEEDRVKTSRASLSQNYPNPFNPITRIAFTLPHESKVTLKVYDIAGRVITTLVNNEIKAAGIHFAIFEATELPSGIYFYKLETESYSNIKKMILLK
jgi:hypothetical protein